MTQTLHADERIALDHARAIRTPVSASATTETRFGTFAITFGIAFAILYTILERQNWPLFTYHPAVGKVDFWMHAARSGEGPPMYWYGWLVTSLLGATAVSLVSWPIARRASTQFWLGWVVPIVVGVIFLYLFRSFFMH